MSELMKAPLINMWMESAVKNCVEELRNGTYNSDVKNNLAYRQRIGTILRKDYWNWFPDMDILDFMNLPCKQNEYELMLPKITWCEEMEQKLLI